MATQENEVSLQGKRETFQGHKTLKMGGLDRSLNSFHLLEEMTQEQHLYQSFSVMTDESNMETEEGSDQPFQSWKCVI